MSALLLLMVSPHRRARLLVDDKLDAERDRVALADADAAWLEAHLADCPECRAFSEERRSLLDLVRSGPAITAPTGFAGRVMLAAKARGRVAEPAPEPRGWSPRFAWVAGAAACAVVAFATVNSLKESAPTPHLEVSGHGAALPEAHFTVRAVGVGPAKAKASVRTIVESAGGAFAGEEGAVYARIPRSALVRVLQDLSKQGSYKVVQSQAELDPELSEIVIAFELE